MRKLLEFNDSSDKILVDVGTKAPDFTLNNENGDTWRLSDCLGEVVALLFYPQNETLVCTRQMCSLRDHWEDYLATKATIIGISPGVTQENKTFAQRHNLPLSLLGDSNRDITKLYSKHWLFPINFTRAVVVIDAKGFIRSREIMLRAFRPSDNKVIAAIYAARGDALSDKFDEIIKKTRTAKIFEEVL